MVRRGSTVRVRQRALHKAVQMGMFCRSELAELAVVGQPSRGLGRGRARGQVREPDLVEEYAVAAPDYARSLGILGGAFQPGAREDGHIHVEPSLIEDAPLERPPDSGRFEEGEQRPAEGLDPPFVAEVAIGLIDDERKVDVGPLVGRCVGARARADEEDSVHVVARIGPAHKRREEQVRAHGPPTLIGRTILEVVPEAAQVIR
jgi:hypothetical protein